MPTSRANKMVDSLARFYVKDNSTTNMDNFVQSFYRQLEDWQVPWMDIPFYINSITLGNFPKEIREKFIKQGLVGSPNLSDDERAKLSIEYFMENKLNIIQRYMDWLVIYIRTKGFNIKMLSLRKAAEAFTLSEERMKELLSVKNIPLYDILGDIRVKESDLALLLTTCRLKKPSGLRSDVGFKDGSKQEAKSKKNNQRSKKEAQETTSAQPNRETSKQPAPKPYVPEKGMNIADDDVSVSLFEGQPMEAEQDTPATTVLPIIPVASSDDTRKDEPTEAADTNPQPFNTEGLEMEIGDNAAPATEEATTEQAPQTTLPDVSQSSVASAVMQNEGSIDTLAFFNREPLPMPEDVTDGDIDNEFEMGDNTFPDEASDNPPASPSYRNRE